MLPANEISDPNSCLNRSAADEPVFVLAARDQTAPTMIRMWCHQRIALRYNRPDDSQIRDALVLADAMETWVRSHPRPKAIIL